MTDKSHYFLYNGDAAKDLCNVEDILLCTYTSRELNLTEGPAGLQLSFENFEPSKTERVHLDPIRYNIEDLKSELVKCKNKKHKCTKCDYQAKKPRDLRNHQRVHMKEYPYHCTECPKQFSRQDSVVKITHFSLLWGPASGLSVYRTF